MRDTRKKLEERSGFCYWGGRSFLERGLKEAKNKDLLKAVLPVLDEIFDELYKDPSEDEAWQAVDTLWFLDYLKKLIEEKTKS